MNIFKFYVIVVNNIVELRRLPLPRCFPKWLSDQLGLYVTIRTRAGISWMVTVEKSSDGRVYLGGQGWTDFAGHHSLTFGHFLLFHCKRPDSFKVIICDQTFMVIDYPVSDYASQPSNELQMGNDNDTLEKCTFTKIMTASDLNGRQTIVCFVSHERRRVVVDGKRSEESRISWNFCEGRWEGAICSGGWRYALKKLNPSEGDVVEFKLVFD
ncbi:hypothetical protein ACFE04_007438 [Oxalis oulophora]